MTINNFPINKGEYFFCVYVCYAKKFRFLSSIQLTDEEVAPRRLNDFQVKDIKELVSETWPTHVQTLSGPQITPSPGESLERSALGVCLDITCRSQPEGVNLNS